MAKPIATTEQKEKLNAALSQSQLKKSTLETAAALQDDKIYDLGVIDDAFKALYNWYNVDIIGNYDIEKRNINGIYQASPILEADFTDVVKNPPEGRFAPTSGYNIIRIAEFDGGNTTTGLPYEELTLYALSVYEDYLTVGLGGTSPGGTIINVATTTEIMGGYVGAIQTVTLDDTVDQDLALSIGDRFLITDGSNSCAVEVDSFTSPAADIYVVDVIQLLPLDTIVIAIGAGLNISFSGFTNAERLIKTATNIDEQNVMDSCIDVIAANFQTQRERIALQLVALGNNDDPDGILEISSAITNANDASTFALNWVLSTQEIDDVTLGSIAAQRIARSAFLVTRLAQINANYTGQTENYYNRRYEIANNRGNLERGTLKMKANAEFIKTQMLAMAVAEQDKIDAFNDVL